VSALQRRREWLPPSRFHPGTFYWQNSAVKGICEMWFVGFQHQTTEVGQREPGGGGAEVLWLLQDWRSTGIGGWERQGRAD